ncbi:cyclic GMP-AMP synthase [Erethizon dorsatum]
MAQRRRKTERTAPEARAAFPGGPEPVLETALAEPSGSRSALPATPARAGQCGPPAWSPPAQRRAARKPREEEEQQQEDSRDSRDPRDPREERQAQELAVRRPRASSRATPARSREPPCLCKTGASPGDWQLSEVLDRLRLRREEISAAAKVVNLVVERLQRALQTSEFRGASVLRSGSYYEHVKISAPNEFDVMFKLEVPRIQLEEYSNSGAYYFVKFKRNPKENLLNKFVENELLSASKMLLKFRKIIKEEIENITDMKVALERKRRGSPAVTLLIREPKEISVDIILALESKSSWPPTTTEGLPVRRWLGGKVRTELRRQPFYLVPKHAKEGQSFQEETWRLSFSHIEKDILNNHGDSKKCCEADGVKCCRKDCLKLMKYLLEQLKKKFEKRKELTKFCSYHVKTAFLHLCAEHPLDSLWNPENIHLRFDDCVAFFLERLRKEELKHFFIPGVNLFSQEHIDTRSKTFLAEQIEYERNNKFPIFSEF